MEFSLDNGSGQYRIKSYHQGIFTVNEITYSSSIIVMPNQLISPWRPSTIETLQIEDFQLLLDIEPQIVLLGTGKSLIFPNRALFSNLYEKKIGVEIMDTPAACRTYMLLMAEGRKVAAALLA
jgi:uncharacterized protein